jgi:hypothetical protein
MNVTRDVILDLLPLYLAGEVSADTRSLVKTYLDQDPDLARMATRGLDEVVVTPPPAPLSKDLELQTLERTKTMLKLRSLLMGVAIFFTTAPLAGYQVGRHRWSMISDLPAGAIACGVVAVGAWLAYAGLQRKLRSTGV